MLPPLEQTDEPTRVLMLWTAAAIGDFIVTVTVGAMLRFRARSVFNTPPEVHPAPALDCYAQGLRRVPWLFITEAVRNFVLVFAAFFFVIPAVFLGFRLSFATEAVVLSEPHLAGAFRRSFRFTEGRFERWLEMIALSVMLGFGVVFLAVATGLLVGSRNNSTLVAASQLSVAAITPIIQYAWTFFYLRLVEIDGAAPGVEVGPAYAALAPTGAPPAAEALAASSPPVLTLVRTPGQGADPEPGSPGQ
jgi:hypothetical protein